MYCRNPVEPRNCSVDWSELKDDTRHELRFKTYDPLVYKTVENILGKVMILNTKGSLSKLLPHVIAVDGQGC